MTTTGVSYPSYSLTATAAMITGSAHADYPVTNLTDLARVSKPFKASASGAIAFSLVLAADQLVRFVALVRHNGIDAGTYRIRLYSDAGMTALVNDSGTLSFSLSAARQFLVVTPYLLAAALTVRAVRIDLSDPGVAWSIGAVEVSGFWDLSTASARSLGLKAQDTAINVGDGASHGTRQFSPRIVTLGLEGIDWTTDGVTAFDFNLEKGLDLPFVYVRDYDTATTWPREAILVRNASLLPVNKDFGTYGSLGLNLIEHIR